MWKYVSRRLRDTVERTYNILDVRRTWTCGSDCIQENNTRKSSSSAQRNEVEILPQPQNLFIWRYSKPNNHKENSSSSSSTEDAFKQKYYDYQGKCNFQLIDALTWSSAILCGWYTTQILCLKCRRRQIRKEWNKHPKEIVAYNFSQPYHSCILAKYLAVTNSRKYQRNDVSSYTSPKENFAYDSKYKNFYRPVPINNDKSIETNIEIPATATPDNKSQKELLERAIEDLEIAVGNIEFQLGLQNMQADKFSVAVSHFKLATSHHHAGATFNLGVCYELGIGVEKDLKNAMECYRAASVLGHKKALYNLGVFYVHGLGGLKKSRRAALACFIAADKLGLKDARDALDMPKETKASDTEVFLKSKKNHLNDVKQSVALF